MEIKNPSDKEIALRALKYVEQFEALNIDIDNYLNGKSSLSEEDIREKYKYLKTEIKKEAHYLGLERNNVKRKTNIYYTFACNIKEASAFGFSASTNAPVNEKMSRSIAEARYRMTKHYRWKEIAEQ